MTNDSILINKKNIYSQNGEDGIINYIFKKLNITKGNFIEFGAWDGKHLSNTYNLFLNGWDGIYIELDKKRSEQLFDNFYNYKERITCINTMVGYSENDNLDTIIDSSSHPNKNFDFISIDVDGLDYFIFKSINKYLPKVICIEVNAGHDPLYENEIPLHIASNNIGQSIKIINDVAEQKGYFSLCYTGNLFLIKNEFKHLFYNDIKNIKDIYVDFLKYLDRPAIIHLYNTFILKKIYNGFLFENNTLQEFLDKR